MSSEHYQTHEWAQRHRKQLSTRNTHQDALTDRQFQRLLEGCEKLKPPQDAEARLICLLAGRLGLRAGEITHLRADWVNWDRKLIEIPKYEPCECGTCRRQAKQEATHNDDLTKEAAMDDRWHPKTIASARIVPYDISLRVELAIERFADQYESFPRSQATVNRRVNAAADEADLNGRVYPHCLRATAASFHAYRGVSPVPLQSLMGWSDLSTAQKYIRISGTATAKAVRQAHHQ